MRQSTRILMSMIVMLGLVVASWPANAQSQPDQAVVIRPGDSIKIGIAVDLSNILAASGLDIAQSASLAFDEFNAEGGLEGFEIEAIIEDDRCTADDAVPVAESFAAEPTLVAVVGHTCSGASIAASEIYQEARIPMVSASSTAGRFTARGLDVVNRTAFNDNIQGIVAARYIYEVLKPDSIVILNNGTPYGEGLAETVRVTYEDLGGEVVLNRAIDLEAGDYSDVVDEIAPLAPDLIYLGGYNTEAAILIEQLRTSDLDEVIFFGADGMFNQDYLDFADVYADGTYVTFGVQSGNPTAYNDFVERYEAAYGLKPTDLGNYGSQAYDAANLILAALVEVAEVDADGNLVIEREALIAAIRATSDYEGISGVITCDENGDCGRAEITVHLADGGQWIKLGVPPNLQVQQ
jgi:branched-chain amino acid transport system substrate-binding protein